jgi:hypothetical protein
MRSETELASRSLMILEAWGMKLAIEQTAAVTPMELITSAFEMVHLIAGRIAQPPA